VGDGEEEALHRWPREAAEGSRRRQFSFRFPESDLF
jgi:hypothetical protein